MNKSSAKEKAVTGGNTKKKWFIIGGSVIIVGTLLVIGIILFMLPGKADNRKPKNQITEAPGPQPTESRPFTHIWPMKEFTVTLAGMGGGQKLIISIQLDLVNPEVQEELTLRSEQIRNYVEQLLLGKTISEISTTDGKIILRNEIIRKLNNVLETGNVRNIYFTEFIII